MAVDLEAIRRGITDELEPARGERGKFYCPLCGSGKGPKKTGAFSIMADGIHGHCFSCGFHGDRFDLVAARDQITLAEATRRLIEKYQPGEIRSRRSSPEEDFSEPYRAEDAAADERRAQAMTDQAAAPAAGARDFSEYVARAHAALPGSAGETYLKGRGFTAETLERFKLGYDPEHFFPARGTFPAIVFPYDPTGRYCGWRAITEKHFDKPKAAEAGPEPVFNAGALYSGEPCFVVESQLDAITLEQHGGRAVAIGGTGGKYTLLRQLEKRAPAGPLILCLDYYNKELKEGPGLDPAGRKATAEIGEALEARKIFCVDGAAAIMGEGCKDPNEVLTTNGPEELFRVVAEVVADTRSEYDQQQHAAEAEREKRTGAGMVEAFFEDVQTRKYEPIPTGIRDIDAALDGGFMRQQLITLGAAPGAGKTALAQWIFEGLAGRGYDCVFLNLEMSRNQIMARSFSRFMAQRGTHISNIRMLRGYLWTEEQRAAIMAAKPEYTKQIAEHLIYNPDEITNSLDSILEYLEAEAQRAEAQDRPAPFAVIDYLQILKGGEREDATETIKRAVVTLKAYAMQHNTVVFLIMAHNRDSNKKGIITMESGRDTSAIEYSGDTQIGLTFTRCLPGWKNEKGEVQKKGKSPDDLTEEDRKWITLKIVKGRFGGTGRRVNLRFEGATMTYTQLFDDFTVVDEETPFDDDEPEARI